MSEARHPGKTAAQKRALDAIGCGNFSPIMAKATRDSMLKAGLIEPCGTKILGRGPLAIRIEEYQMPIPVHMQWCAAVAAEDDGTSPPRKDET